MIYLVGFSVLVDFVNGLFLNVFGTSFGLSSTYKLLTVMFFLYYLSTKNLAKFLVSLALIIYFISLILIQHFTVGIVSIEYDLMFRFKFVFIVISFLTISEFISNCSQRDIDLVEKFMFFSFTIVIANILIGLLGFGSYTYPSHEIGFKGFFYAGNELSALCIILFSFVLVFVRSRKFDIFNLAIYLFLSVLIFFSSYLLSTKSIMLSSLILVFSVFFSHQDTPVYVKVLSITTILLCSLFIGFNVFSNTNFSQMLINNYESGGMMKLVFSTRNEWFEAIYIKAINLDEFSVWFFGFNYNDVYPILGKGSTESDLFDIFIYFGFSGVLVFLVSVVYLYTVAMQVSSKLYRRVLFVTLSLLICFGVLAGHVFSSALLALPLATYFYYMIYISTENLEAK